MPYADPEVRREYHRQYNLKVKGKYSFTYKVYDSWKNANRRAREYGARGELTKEEVRSVLEGKSCHYCGGDHLLGLDHVVPLHAKGSNSIENIVLACRSCNASKWRGTLPSKGKWSRSFDRCVECGSTSSRHASRGRCNACVLRMRKREGS